MRLSGPFLALLLAGTLLSGCTVKEGPIALSGTRGIPTTASGTIPPPHPVAVTGSNSTGTPGSGADTGAIAAKLVSDFAKGLAPLKVTFTLNATFIAADGTTGNGTGAGWAVVYGRLDNKTGALVASTLKDGPHGDGVPAKFNLTFTQVGNYTVSAVVGEGGYMSNVTEIQITVLSNLTGPGAPGGAIFFDGGEGDDKLWTIKSTVLAGTQDPSNGKPVTQNTPAPYASGEKWAIDAAKFQTGAKSWWSQYPDNYETTMTSAAIAIPDGAHKLKFSVIGGAEANAVDGLFVKVGADAATLEEKLYITDSVPAWSTKLVDLSAFAGKTVVIQFAFDSDPSCSSTTPLPAGCGPGADGGGFWLDDITVT